MSGIKTPLTVSDATEMAHEVLFKRPYDALAPWSPLVERMVHALIGVDMASREQAREDIASGVSPLPILRTKEAER